MSHDKCLISWFSFKLFFWGYGGLLYYSFCFYASQSSPYTFKQLYELYEV